MSYELVVYLYYACRVTENKIKKILEEAEIIISAGKISNILTQEKRRRKSRMGEHDVMSILNTCKKQMVGFFDYIRDTFPGNRAMTRFAQLISRNHVIIFNIHLLLCRYVSSIKEVFAKRKFGWMLNVRTLLRCVIWSAHIFSYHSYQYPWNMMMNFAIGVWFVIFMLV